MAETTLFLVVINVKQDVPSAAAAQRDRLRAAVLRLGDAIDMELVEPCLPELEALALLCEDHRLPIEAARVRRWLTGGMVEHGRGL